MIFSGLVTTIGGIFAIFFIDQYFFSIFIVGMAMMIYPLIISNVFQNREVIEIKNPLTKTTKGDAL